MAKAIETEDLRIHCDLCHHEFPGDPHDWHNQPCPECGEGVLISDEDLAFWKGTLAIMETINGIFGELPDDGPTAMVAIDTAGLRSNT